jgi:hypothetical protein
VAARDEPFQLGGQELGECEMRAHRVEGRRRLRLAASCGAGAYLAAARAPVKLTTSLSAGALTGGLQLAPPGSL